MQRFWIWWDKVTGRRKFYVVICGKSTGNKLSWPLARLLAGIALSATPPFLTHTVVIKHESEI